MNRTYLRAVGPARTTDRAERRHRRGDYRWTGHTWLTIARTRIAPGGPFITMDRTYLARPDIYLYGRQLAMFETYEAFVHHDGPDIPRACTHDEPDILFTMNRTYLARALTMNRT